MSGSPDGTRMLPRRVLVVMDSFPNRIQPWVLNAITEVMHHGFQVFIAAGGRRGNTYPAAVDEHGLRGRTVYVQPASPRGLLQPLAYMVGPSPELRQAARAGLLRAIARPNGVDFRSLAKNVALAVPIGLRNLSLVHAHSLTMGYEFLRVAKLHRIPLLQTFHGLQPAGVRELSMPKMQRLFSEASCFLVNTEAARSQLLNRGCSPEKTRILPQGTDLDRFPFEPQRYPAAGPVRFLTVGRLQEEKGHLYALRALARLSTAGLSLTYRIVGTGPFRQLLEDEALRLGLEERVTFTGEVYDQALRKEYRQAHILLFPSVRDPEGGREETQGVAIQEAQASGCIVIATRTGGIPESVDERCVHVVRDRDVDALAAAIQSVVRQPEHWEEWQKAGRRWVEDRYAIEVIGARLAGVYHRLLEGRDDTRRRH